MDNPPRQLEDTDLFWIGRATSNVLINHPSVGSLWLSNARLFEGHVIGETWDDSDVGSAYLPDDYQGQPVTMNFPISCIRKGLNKPNE